MGHHGEGRPNSCRSTQLTKFNKKNVKDKRIILDSIKDHVIPHVTRKKYAFEM